MNDDATGVKWMLAFVVAAAAAVAWMYFTRDTEPTPTRSGSVQHTAAPVAATHYPIAAVKPSPAAVSTATLPGLQQSDGLVVGDLLDLAAGDSLKSLLVSKAVIPRIVATVDALPRRRLAPNLLPVRSAAGPYLVADTASGTVRADANVARYAPYMRVIESIDTREAVAWYANHYPLFQQAYRELGYPSGYFNDRLIAVIDHLLAAPEHSALAVLVADKGVYVYANPQLESLSAGQKLLLRVGGDNRRTIEDKLRVLRNLLTGGAVGSLHEPGADHAGEGVKERDQKH